MVTWCAETKILYKCVDRKEKKLARFARHTDNVITGKLPLAVKYVSESGSYHNG